jgi:[ribosomal protein S18]-alanine N-acetyltransferase
VNAPFTVAEAAPADASSLAALYAEALPPGWPEAELAAICADPRRALLQATDAAGPHGFVLLQFAADEAEILAIAVAEASRRRGCASSLLRAAIKLCESNFVTCIYLEVAESNNSARGLYETFGFMEIGRRKDYYRSARFAPESAVTMKLGVQPHIGG